MKRIVSLLLVFVLCFCLCACSTTENSNTPSESQTPTTGTPPQGEVQGNSNPNDVSSEPSDSQDATEEVDPKVKALADFHDKYRIGTEMKLGESYNCCDLFEITPINFEFGAYAVDSTEIRVEHLGVWMQAKLTNISGSKLDAQTVKAVFPYFLSNSLFEEDQDAFVVWLDKDYKVEEYGNHLFCGAIAQIGSSAAVQLMDIEPGQTIEVNVFVGGQRESKQILINGNQIFDQKEPEEHLLTIKDRIAGYVKFVFGDDVYYFDLSSMP